MEENTQSMNETHKAATGLYKKDLTDLIFLVNDLFKPQRLSPFGFGQIFQHSCIMARFGLER